MSFPEETRASPDRVAGWIVPAHVVGCVLTWSAFNAVGFTLAFIAKKEFGANHWQMLLVTALPLVMMVLSIFWGDVLKRVSLPKYLILFWLVALLPLAGIALAREFWQFAVPFVVYTLGMPAWPAVNGEIMQQLYPDRSRGRYFGVVVTCTVLATAFGALGLYRWLHVDPQAFRVFLPAIAGVQLLGIAWLCVVLKRAGVLDRRSHLMERDTRTFSERVFEPLTHTGEVLRNDRVFARYEAAFMTYGAAWMICEALRPDLIVDKLKLDYESIGVAHAFMFQIAQAASMFLAGAVMDRLGAARLCAWTFAVYTVYPVILIIATGKEHLIASSVVYGLCNAGVNAGWLLGPVSLAPSREKVPQYVAIHATMVGLRGTVFQFLGVVLHALTGSFTLSFSIASLCFAWAAWQMWALHRVMNRSAAQAPAR